ncbi:MAG: S66 peptidase family protein [Gemmatimonadales bacterium]
MGSKPIVCPPRLRRGSRVALVAPAGPLLERDDIARAGELCCALGYEPVVGLHAAGRFGYLAGTDAERLADLNDAIGDDGIDAVWCLRGGYGVTRVLDGVDFDALVRRPKAVIGFSDITALLAGVTRMAGVVAYHAPVARNPMPAFSRRHFERVLTRAEPAGVLEPLPAPLDVLVPRNDRVIPLREGIAEGTLAGGNLSLLQCLIGTRWFPDLDGAILVLEDVNEDLYRVDRILAHLRAVGALSRLAGVAVGRFTEIERHTPDGAFGFDELLGQYLLPLGVPVAIGFPFGHIDAQWTLPLGVRARLDAGRGILEIVAPAVA